MQNFKSVAAGGSGSGSGGGIRKSWLAATAAIAIQGMVVGGAVAHDSHADLVEELKPTVVSIYVSKESNLTAEMPQFQFPEGSPFRELFRDYYNQRNRPENRMRRGMALGSGFIIDPDGYIVTNNHVIEDARKVTIQLHDGEEYRAEIIGADPKTDIALLKVEADRRFPFATFGDSEQVRVGDPVLAIGNPHGLGFSVSAGIISARNRSLRGTYDDFLQTDAAINVGNSGGPLFNMDGEVIGVNTAIIGTSRGIGGSPGSLGIGFSMSSAVVTKVVAQLEEFGTTRRGWVGVVLQEVTPEIADAVGLDEASGGIIVDVPEGPARDAGLQVGDIILSFDGIKVDDVRSIVRVIGDAEVGILAPIVVFREGEEVTLTVKIARREEAEPLVVRTSADPGEPIEQDELGLLLTPLTSELRQQNGLAENQMGLLVTDVDDSSAAYEQGIRQGDVIVEFDYNPVETVWDVREGIDEVIDSGRSSVLVMILRDDDRRYVALPLGNS